jgi:hypothetical protein
MSTNRDRNAALILEVVLCFGLPVCYLVWGLIALPFLVGGIPSGNEFAIWPIFSVCAGCCGVAALVGFFRYYFSEESDGPKRISSILFLGLVGLAGIWSVGTDHFTKFDSISILLHVLPTLSFLHLAVLLVIRHRESQ